MPDTNPSNIKIFHAFWLRKDPVGDLLIGAMSISSSNLDSATLFIPPGGYFTHQFLVPGYTREYLWAGQFGQDSTMSNNETVQVPAGTFTNCIKSREIHRDSLNNITFLEYHYYAHGIGMVLNVREIPVNYAHRDELIQYNTLTSIDEKSRSMGPTGFALEQNYPNPFNPATTISFSLPSQSFVSLKVLDALGRELSTLLADELPAGNYSRRWNAATLPSGVYFYRLQACSFTETKKAILLR